ncbi:MAG: IS200/IS605 family transposase [Cyclobacteriaceae bacterium]|nr:IS200/IS605 family transposase [Cyclobacteriaceae bacterium]MCK5367840.1 IS200/IS605 family transposase [Cyclobacteriaceae bacterium]
MDEHIYKRHNKTLLLYHLVFPLKYRRSVITEEVGLSLKEVCLGISERYEVQFVEVGYEPDHVHFLVQSVPSMSVSELVRKIKSITAKQLFTRHPEIKAKLWGGNFWTSGYYANTVGQYGNAEVIRKYVENQGKKREYKKVHSEQLSLFDE